MYPSRRAFYFCFFTHFRLKQMKHTQISYRYTFTRTLCLSLTLSLSHTHTHTRLEKKSLTVFNKIRYGTSLGHYKTSVPHVLEMSIYFSVLLSKYFPVLLSKYQGMIILSLLLYWWPGCRKAMTVLLSAYVIPPLINC